MPAECMTDVAAAVTCAQLEPQPSDPIISRRGQAAPGVEARAKASARVRAARGRGPRAAGERPAREASLSPSIQHALSKWEPQVLLLSSASDSLTLSESPSLPPLPSPTPHPQGPHPPLSHILASCLPGPYLCLLCTTQLYWSWSTPSIPCSLEDRVSSQALCPVCLSLTLSLIHKHTYSLTHSPTH